MVQSKIIKNPKSKSTFFLLSSETSLSIEKTAPGDLWVDDFVGFSLKRWGSMLVPWTTMPGLASYWKAPGGRNEEDDTGHQEGFSPQRKKGWKREGWLCRRTRPKICQLSSDGCFFWSGALWHCHPSQTVGFLKKKNTCQHWNQGKIAKGRPIVLAKDWIHCCFAPGFVGCFFSSMTQFYPLGLTCDTFDSRSPFNLRSLIVYIRIMPRECGSWRRNMRRKSHGVMIKGWVSLGLMILMALSRSTIFVVQRSIDSTMIKLVFVYIVFVWLWFVGYSTALLQGCEVFHLCLPRDFSPFIQTFTAGDLPQERQALAEETEQKNAKALQGRTVSLVQEIGRVFFCLAKKSLGVV